MPTIHAGTSVYCRDRGTPRRWSAARPHGGNRGAGHRHPTSRFRDVLVGRRENRVQAAAVVFATAITAGRRTPARSEEHTSELQSLMRTSYAVYCLHKNTILT